MPCEDNVWRSLHDVIGAVLESARDGNYDPATDGSAE
jgi:hypothetical protein